MNGTIKIGRWEYPAVQAPDGSVTRNTKRDGTGDTVDADPGKFVPAAASTPAPAPAAPAAPEVEGFTADDGINLDRDELLSAYKHIFADFAVSYDELADYLGVKVARAKAVVSTLNRFNLTTTDMRGGTGTDKAETIIQSWKTYDDHTEAEIVADFEERVPADVKVRAGSTHGGKVGAQHKKPGRSSWAVGDKCPQGHTITDANGDNAVYRMPSGRNQCRKCRAGYPSNTD